jgi:hypothetical protein
MKIHVEVYIASRILGKNQGTFAPQDIVHFIQTEFQDSRPGVTTHAGSVCVANAPLNYPTGYNYLWRTEHATLRVFRPGIDLPLPERKNCIEQPNEDDIPKKYRHLVRSLKIDNKAYQQEVTTTHETPKVILETQNHSGEKKRFRSSASFGKREEYIAVAELLRRGHDVYMTLVDDQQIDCIIRQEKNGQRRYLDIQIKARSLDAKNPALFAAMEVRTPRENFFYIFYSESANTYWIVPSLELVSEAHQNKEGVNKGKFSITFANIRKDGVRPRPRFTKYQNAFQLLEWN